MEIIDKDEPEDTGLDKPDDDKDNNISGKEEYANNFKKSFISLEDIPLTQEEIELLKVPLDPKYAELYQEYGFQKAQSIIRDNIRPEDFAEELRLLYNEHLAEKDRDISTIQSAFKSELESIDAFLIHISDRIDELKGKKQEFVNTYVKSEEIKNRQKDLRTEIEELYKELDAVFIALGEEKAKLFRERFENIKKEIKEILNFKDEIEEQVNEPIKKDFNDSKEVRDELISFLKDLKESFKNNFYKIQRRTEALGFAGIDSFGLRVFFSSIGFWGTFVAGWLFVNFTSSEIKYVNEEIPVIRGITDSTRVIGDPPTYTRRAAADTLTRYVITDIQKFPSNTSVLYFTLKTFFGLSYYQKENRWWILLGIIIFVIAISVLVIWIEGRYDRKKDDNNKTKNENLKSFSLDVLDHNNFLKININSSNWKELWFQLLPFLIIFFVFVLIYPLSIGKGSFSDDLQSLYDNISNQLIGMAMVWVFAGLIYLYVGKVIEPRIDSKIAKKIAKKKMNDYEPEKYDDVEQTQIGRSDNEHITPDQIGIKAKEWIVWNWEIFVTMILFLGFFILLVIDYRISWITIQQVSILGFIVMALGSGFATAYYYRYRAILNLFFIYNRYIYSISEGIRRLSVAPKLTYRIESLDRLLQNTIDTLLGFVHYNNKASLQLFTPEKREIFNSYFVFNENRKGGEVYNNMDVPEKPQGFFKRVFNKPVGFLKNLFKKMAFWKKGEEDTKQPENEETKSFSTETISSHQRIVENHDINEEKYFPVFYAMIQRVNERIDRKQAEFDAIEKEIAGYWKNEDSIYEIIDKQIIELEAERFACARMRNHSIIKSVHAIRKMEDEAKAKETRLREGFVTGRWDVLDNNR